MEIILNPDPPTDFSSRLPDDIILEILNKVIDLKSLCFCKLVSRRFNKIVNKVETVSLSYWKPLYKKPLIKLLKPFKFLLGRDQIDDYLTDPFDIKSFRSAYMFMYSFRELRNLCIELPGCVKGVDDRRILFKWKVKYRKNKVDSFVFLSPNSIYDNNGFLLYRGRGVNSQEAERDNDGMLILKKAEDCFMDMIVRIWVILNCIVDFPLLEKVCVRHSDKKGGSVCVGGEKLSELRNSGWYPSEYLTEMVNTCSCSPVRMSWCFVPLLKLPVSGYVMKGVTLYIITMADDHRDVVIDRFINNDDDDDDDDNNEFEDKAMEAAYSEAIIQIFKKHKSLMWFDSM